MFCPAKHRKSFLFLTRVPLVKGLFNTPKSIMVPEIQTTVEKKSVNMV